MVPPEAGSRADEENKDKVDKLALELLNESYRTQLNFKDGNKKFAVRLPAFFAQETLWNSGLTPVRNGGQNRPRLISRNGTPGEGFLPSSLTNFIL